MESCASESKDITRRRLWLRDGDKLAPPTAVTEDRTCSLKGTNSSLYDNSADPKYLRSTGHQENTYSILNERRAGYRTRGDKS
ncbi:hypothetical protein E2C01_061174 [Portunus trituberculatus]|uniref:Uncharacterized protein n=1 Tax=Portunus trituberculatus TaxID=210409 RepID=A0A5B7HEC2_PORTR|nr:hypothetical protein [Portunus trituberculatus]